MTRLNKKYLLLPALAALTLAHISVANAATTISSTKNPDQSLDKNSNRGLYIGANAGYTLEHSTLKYTFGKLSALSYLPGNTVGATVSSSPYWAGSATPTTGNAGSTTYAKLPTATSLDIKASQSGWGGGGFIGYKFGVLGIEGHFNYAKLEGLSGDNFLGGDATSTISTTEMDMMLGAQLGFDIGALNAFAFGMVGASYNGATFKNGFYDSTFDMLNSQYKVTAPFSALSATNTANLQAVDNTIPVQNFINKIDDTLGIKFKAGLGVLGRITDCVGIEFRYTFANVGKLEQTISSKNNVYVNGPVMADGMAGTVANLGINLSPPAVGTNGLLSPTSQAAVVGSNITVTASGSCTPSATLIPNTNACISSTTTIAASSGGAISTGTLTCPTGTTQVSGTNACSIDTATTILSPAFASNTPTGIPFFAAETSPANVPYLQTYGTMPITQVSRDGTGDFNHTFSVGLRFSLPF